MSAPRSSRPLTAPRSLVLSLASLALASVLASDAHALRGPPLLCHPFDIGDAESLPFGEGWNDPDPGVDPDTVAQRVVPLLDASDDAIVHMETVRRAVLTVACWNERRHAAGISGLRDALGARARAARAATDDEIPGGDACADKAGGGADDARRHRRALAALDYAVLLEALSEAGVESDDSRDALAWAELAATLEPDDGGVRLGAALVAYSRNHKRTSCEHLEVALRRASDDALLRRNICKTMGPCLDARDVDDLEESVRRVLDRS